MIGRVALAAALALAAAAPAPPPPAAESAPAAASLADRLSWNAGERTRTGISRLGRGEAAAAAAAFDAALRLRPDDPLTSYNAGTGRLAAGRGDALPPLEAAASAAAPDLAPDAWYNLGNARLAAGDARGAVDAYVETLRRQSDRLEAKKNLELALRALERQQQQPAPAPRPAPADGEPSGAGAEGGDPPRADEGGEPGAGAEPTPGARAPAPADEPGAHRAPPAGRSPEGPATDSGRRGLRDFRDQPELDAEQAAALLAAVENLERQQRRTRAVERARARGSSEKDW